MRTLKKQITNKIFKDDLGKIIPKLAWVSKMLPNPWKRKNCNEIYLTRKQN